MGQEARVPEVKSYEGDQEAMKETRKTSLTLSHMRSWTLRWTS